jgi:hypothetical protein
VKGVQEDEVRACACVFVQCGDGWRELVIDLSHPATGASIAPTLQYSGAFRWQRTCMKCFAKSAVHST